MRKYQESVHDFRVILNPDVLKRLKEEDEEFLVELERRYAGRLMFRGDPTYHHEKFTITDANTGAGIKALTSLENFEKISHYTLARCAHLFHHVRQT